MKSHIIAWQEQIHKITALTNELLAKFSSVKVISTMFENDFVCFTLSDMKIVYISDDYFEDALFDFSYDEIAQDIVLNNFRKESDNIKKDLMKVIDKEIERQSKH